MKQCLIIDDSPVIRKVARVIIADFGFQIREAEHGRQGFEQCALEMPDVILLDWQMPVMGAHEFLKALRVYAPSKRPFIFYCTTEIDFIDVQHARAAGANDIILKPFDRGSLTAKFARFSDVLAMKHLAMTAPDGPWPREALAELPPLGVA